MIREVAEETGCAAVVDRLLGVDSRMIPAVSARAGVERQNVGIYYGVRITGGQLRPEPNGEIAESVWTPFADMAGAGRRWSTRHTAMFGATGSSEGRASAHSHCLSCTVTRAWSVHET